MARRPTQGADLSRATLQILSLSGLIALLLPITVFGPSFLVSIHTPYCPWSHKVDEDIACHVLDQEGNGERLLIQHAQLDGAWAYLEIHEPGEDERSLRFEIPSFVEELAPLGYRGRLISYREDAVRINGEVQVLTPLP